MFTAGCPLEFVGLRIAVSISPINMEPRDFGTSVVLVRVNTMNMVNTQTQEPQPLVILVHGIRDFGLWQSVVQASLEHAGFRVEPTNYGRLNLVEFLMPIWFFRRRAIETVWKQIRIIRQNNPHAALSMVAHSFGTFVVAHLMKENFDIEFHRIIFCGSVVDYGFEFEQFQTRFTPPIVNEVGTRDIWPAIAESVTFGYGSAGTYGFHRALVRDRWHNGARHGFFLNREFCTQFWIPFLRDGVIAYGAEEPKPPQLWVQLLSIFKIKYLLVFLLLCAMIAPILPMMSSGNTRNQFDVLHTNVNFLSAEYNNRRPNYALLSNKRSDGVLLADQFSQLDYNKLNLAQKIQLRLDAAQALLLTALIEDLAPSADRKLILRCADRASEQAQFGLDLLLEYQNGQSIPRSEELDRFLRENQTADRTKLALATAYAVQHKHDGKSATPILNLLSDLDRVFRADQNILGESIFKQLCEKQQSSDWSKICSGT
jgi:hypothetical protein